MKNSILVIVILAICAINSSAENQKTINNSDITGVKVFLSGAQVTRTFRTNVDAGVSTIVVSDLSAQIDKSSISVGASGDVMILGTSYALDYLSEHPLSPKIKSLKDSIEIMMDAQNELNVLKSVYNDEIAMLNSNKTVGGANTGLTQENLQKVSDFYSARMKDLKLKLLDLDKKVTKNQERLSKLNNQLSEETNKLKRPYGTIVLTVSAKQPVSANFELSYYANGASWSPSYDIRSVSMKSEVILGYKAHVIQSTGEDWKNVHVILSSGNPTLGGNKPELSPWYLSFGYERSDKEIQLRKLPGVANDGYTSGAQDSKPAPMSVPETVTYSWQNPVETTVQENAIVNEFEINVPYTVMSDGKEVMMDIQTYNLPVTYSYYSATKLDKDAFLMGAITGWEKFSLMPGQANIYLENSYVGESYLNPSVTTDTLKLSFGRDKRIVIKRERVKDMNTQKFIGGNVEKEFMFETTIRNTKKENVTITIEDQLPLSTDENIKITSTELTGGNLNAETGMINWKIELKPGESKSIRLGYKVKYPKDRFIPGI